jgi:nucleoside-diphosphate-sugar epimerase
VKKKIRILITGSKGFVGKNLAKYLKNIKNFIILTDNKKKFDLSKLNQFKKLLILSFI